VGIFMHRLSGHARRPHGRTNFPESDLRFLEDTRQAGGPDHLPAACYFPPYLRPIVSKDRFHSDVTAIWFLSGGSQNKVGFKVIEWSLKACSNATSNFDDTCFPLSSNWL
jgi:hypothetical protein